MTAYTLVNGKITPGPGCPVHAVFSPRGKYNRQNARRGNRPAYSARQYYIIQGESDDKSAEAPARHPENNAGPGRRMAGRHGAGAPAQAVPGDRRHSRRRALVGAALGPHPQAGGRARVAAPDGAGRRRVRSCAFFSSRRSSSSCSPFSSTSGGRSRRSPCTPASTGAFPTSGKTPSR